MLMIALTMVAVLWLTVTIVVVGVCMSAARGDRPAPPARATRRPAHALAAAQRRFA
jgi:hypothetical protein